MVILQGTKGVAMPHHWRPIKTDEPAPNYQGKDKDGVTWGLVEITEAEAKEIERKPKKHDCERVLRP
jgi:hypothetical protein